MLPKFEDFTIVKIDEESTFAEDIKKKGDLHDKKSKLKDDLEKAVKTKDNKQIRICQIKLDLLDLEEQKYKLNKELEKLQK